MARCTAGAAATTAVIVGQEVEAQQHQLAQMLQAPPPAQAAGSDLTSQLQQMAGVMTDKEFAGAKQNILASG